MPKFIRAVVFDAVGTLIHAEPSVAHVYAAVGHRHGSRLDADTIGSRFKAAFQRQEEINRRQHWATNETRERQRWRDIVAEVLGEENVEESFAELYEHFGRPEAWRVESFAGVLLAALRRRGLMIAMASNFDARLHGIVAGLPDLAGFDAVIVSSEVGVRKPGRTFFEAIERRLGIAAAAIAFVGDDPINDGQGAADAGMTSFLLGRDLQTLAEVEGLPRNGPMIA